MAAIAARLSVFPNLFIVGAMKAGTSSLHEYLHQHPQIFMSRFKEPQYFHPHKLEYGYWGQGNPLPEPGIDWYLRLFKDAGSAKFAGESSTSYAKEPIVHGCARRIAEFNREARIVYLLRDPIERTLSHYWYYVTNGHETRKLSRAVRADVQYTAYSHYAMQLEPYLREFGEEQVYVLTVEELNADPANAFGRLFQWLGVDDDFLPVTSMRENVTPATVFRVRRPLWWTSAVRRHWRWQGLEGKLPSVLKKAASAVVFERIERSSVDSADAVEWLRDRQLPETAELVRLTGRGFPEWKSLFAGQNAVSTDLVSA